MNFIYYRLVSSKFIVTSLMLFIALSSFAQNWNETNKVVASDRTSFDYFGYSVSISGEYAIIGAFYDDEDTSGGNTLNAAGSAYFFERNASGAWKEKQKIVASDRDDADIFGECVSISGNYAIVGAPYEDEDASGGNRRVTAGSAYLFERNGSGVWQEVQKIVSSDRASTDQFGTSVSIFGNYAIVGALGEDEDTSGANYIAAAGSAYLFERNASGVWIEVQKIVASDRGYGDQFGGSVAISGNYAIIGAVREDQDTAGGNTLSNSGSAYLFERNASGVWNEVQKLVASDRGLEDKFGISLSISGDYAVIGAYWENEDTTGGSTLNNAGSAYVFERNGLGVWNESQKLVASDRDSIDLFGASVSISGNYAIIGALREGQDTAGVNTLKNAGSAYIFERNGFGDWKEVKKVIASDRDTSDYFGTVSISGNYAIIGARSEDEDTTGVNTRKDAGSAYFFKTPCRLFGAINDTICFRDTVFINGTAYHKANSTGTEIYNNIGTDNCDSIVTISLNVLDTINLTISNNAATLTANQNGATYQWIDCGNGDTIIQSETNQSFTANVNGSYAVIITLNGCKDTSACNTLILVGLVENNFGNKFILFPNPTDGNFSVDLGENYKSITTTITDISGKVIQTNNYSNSQTLNLKLDGPSGIYLLMIQSENKKAVIRIAKE